MRDNTPMRRFLTLLVTVFFHRKTPFSAKLLLGAGALYGLFPVDFIPDLLPVVGQSDDLAAIILTVLFFWWKTRHVREELQTNPSQTAPLK